MDSNLFTDLVHVGEGARVGAYCTAMGWDVSEVVRDAGEIAKRGNSLNPVSIDFQLHQSGSAMSDGRYMTLADVYHDQSFRDSTLIYRVSISSSGRVTKVGTTRIRHSNMRQAFILGAKNTPLND